MSTEHQRYSTLNQMEAIGEYAERNNIFVVRTYADEGKSGLRIENRLALRQLIRDVVNGDADYSLILVYDVSRWGRFQDTDESAHYEFLCRQSGINIEYCAELFVNDGNPLSALAKNMKRIMAAEYSRELSVKVFYAQRRVIRMGYRAGGPAGMGYRRLVIDKDGNPRGIFESGTHKFLATDRTVLVPGPPKEVALVRSLFRSAASGRSIRSISDSLNARGILTPRGNAWTSAALASMLRNEKYIGISIWNRKSFKLRGKTIYNPREEWIRVEGAFKPLVSRKVFDKVQQQVKARKEPRPEAELLDGLRRLLAEKGKLSRELILADKRIPGPSSYDERFGGIVGAYKRIGYVPKRDYSTLATDRKFRIITRKTAATAADRLRDLGCNASIMNCMRSVIVDLEILVLFTTLRSARTKGGILYWRFIPHIRSRTHVIAAARMDQHNKQIQDHMILPMAELHFTTARFHECGGHPLDIYRTDTLDPLYAMLTTNYRADVPFKSRILQAIAETRTDA